MTALQSYRPPARSQAPMPGSVELAYRPIDISSRPDREYLSGVSASSTAQSAEAWINYRRIGEVRYAISRSARIAGYGQLKAVRINDSGQITSERDSGVYAQIVREIYSPFGGVRGLLERFYTLRKVVGDSYLAGVRHNTVDLARDGYWFLSPSEIKATSVTPDIAPGSPVVWQTARRSGAGGQRSVFERRIESRDFLGRVWAPDGEFVDDADTPMSALNSMCDMLHQLTETIKARLNQRLTHAGVFLIPNEISDAAIAGSLPTDARYGTADKVLNYFIHIMTTSAMQVVAGNAADPLTQIPIIMKGPADALEKVRWLLQDIAVQETDIKLRADLINRILDGLDQQKQAATGGEDTSHWGMWAVSDEERRITVQPDIESMCHALTRLVLWPALKDRGHKPAEILPWRVWYDLSAASVKSNMAEDARQAWDRGLVNAAFVRNAVGANDTDVMDADEYTRWVGMKTQNPVLMVHGLEGIEVDWERAERWGGSSGPAPDSPADDPEAGPGVGDPGSPNPADRDSDAPKTEEPG